MRGFTLIEMLVVLAIIAVVVGLLLPAVQTEHERARRTAVSAEIFALAQAESDYLDANGDYGTLDELVEEGLAPGDLLDAKKHGYEFVIEIDPPPLPEFRIRASPCTEPFSVRFFVDQSAVIRWGFDEADVTSPVVVDVEDIPTSPAELELAKRVTRDGGAFVRALVALPGAGDAVQAAIDLLETEDVATALYARLDDDGDGEISVQDFLAMDTLALARAVRDDLGLPDSGDSIGDDAVLNAMIASYKALLGATLQPDEEFVAPAVPYGPGLMGDPVSFLTLALMQGLPALGPSALVLLVLAVLATGVRRSRRSAPRTGRRRRPRSAA